MAAAIGFNSRRASKERRGSSLGMDAFHPRPASPILSRYSTVGGTHTHIYIHMYTMPRHGDYYSLDKLPR